MMSFDDTGKLAQSYMNSTNIYNSSTPTATIQLDQKHAMNKT